MTIGHFPSIYIASRKRNAAILRAYRDGGVPIISTWIDAVDSGRIPKPTQDEIWRNAREEIGRCYTFIFHDGGDGAMLELGIAIALEIPHIAVTQDGPWNHFPGVYRYESLQECLSEAEVPF